MDTDGSGNITVAELFRVTFPNANARARKLMLRWTDPRRTAREVIMAVPKRTVNLRTRLEAEEVFTALDADRDGFVTLDEVREMLELNGSKSEVGLWSLADANDILAKYALTGEPVGKGAAAAARAAAKAGGAAASSPSSVAAKAGKGGPVMDRLGFIRLCADNFLDLQASGGRA